MTEIDIYVILMAGGRGERFWPRSRIYRPKQTLPISSQSSLPLLVESVERMFPLIPESNIAISMGEHLQESFKEILENYKLEWIIEPAQKDTAAAIGYALTRLRHKTKKDFIAVILGSDYRITDPALFRKHLKQAIDLAKKEYIVTLGIRPTRPATGYGYLCKDEFVNGDDIKAYKVKEFKEKPDRKTAESYVESGQYLWNSGMFICSADVMMSELQKYSPTHYDGFERIRSSLDDDNSSWVIKTVFEQLPKISIDYAVMEKTEKLLVLESYFEWDDLGDWTALDRLIQHDARGNAIDGLWAGLDTDDCIIIGKNDSNGKRLIATLGLTDIIIVDTNDVLLISHKDHIHKIKQLVGHINTHKKLKDFL